MKSYIKSFLYLVAVVSLGVSCKKNLPVITLDTTDATSPKLSSTESNIVLLEARAANTAVVFNWTKPAFNFNGSFNYTLQFAEAGTGFAAPVNESIGTDLKKSYTEKAFNALVLSLGVKPGDIGTLEVRIKAVLNDSVAPLYSNVHTIAATPYSLEQFLYVPGAYQGWDPASAEIIRSSNKNNKYEGYIFFTSGNLEYKFTDAPDWNNGIFGDASGGTSGNIASPGDNFKVPAAGYYKINADLVNNTWSATGTNWGLVGDATGSWDNDQDMAYDGSSKTWTITLDLTAGAIKFRANDGWGINLGDTGGDSSLEYNGDNIPIGAAGNYTVVLSLKGGEGKYTYTVTKN